MAVKNVKTIEEQVEKKEMKFTKEQLLASKKFCGKKDLLTALLKDQKLYTSREVEELIEKYDKTEVK